MCLLKSLYLFPDIPICFLVKAVIVIAQIDLPNKKYSEREAEIFQSFYFREVNDSLPLIEEIQNCKCPRIYLPVCASDNKTYTNLCWMNCVATIKKTPLRYVQMGMCVWL